MHAGDDAAGRIGLQPLHIGVGQKRDIRVGQRRIDADDLGVGLAVGQAGKSVIGVAAHAGAVGQDLAVHLVQKDGQRLRKGMVARLLQRVA